MTINKAVYLAAFSIFAFACSKKQSVRDIEPSVINEEKVKLSSSDFEGKSSEEILKIKYDKITLRCDFWMQYAEKLNLTLEANDRFEVDFLNDVILSKSPMKLQGFVNGRTTILNFKLSGYEVLELSRHKDSSGKLYIAKYSPVLTLDYNFWSTINSSENQSSSDRPIEGYNRGTKISESYSSISEEFSTNLDEKNNYINHLSCSLHTVIKEKYKDQFQVIETEKNGVKYEIAD